MFLVKLHPFISSAAVQKEKKTRKKRSTQQASWPSCRLDVTRPYILKNGCRGGKENISSSFTEKLVFTPRGLIQTACWDRTLPALAAGNLGEARGRERSSQKHEALEEFARNLSEGIVGSFLREAEATGEGLAAAVGVWPAGTEDDDEGGHEEGVWRPDGNLVAELQIHNGGRPPLTQAGPSAGGSLDYPDAPPTSPLLPELQRSRKSFSQKLKGGLAKVFPPSPPPPTPMGREASAMDDHQVKMAELLMDSLSLELSRVEELAEALSFAITERVLHSNQQPQMAEDAALLAQRMAEAIIASSLDAAKTSA